MSKVADSIRAALRSSGLRYTPVRAAMLQALSEATGPLSVSQIMRVLDGPVELTTVYRTLETFTKKRLVHRVHGSDRSWSYALSSAKDKKEHQHPHFLCESCGRIVCLEAAKVQKGFVRSLGVGERYVISYPEVILHGLCPKCR